MTKRKQHSPEFKAKFPLKALEGAEAVPELAIRFGTHPTMIHQWKRALIEGASGVSERGRRKKHEIDDEQATKLHGKFGELTNANDASLRDCAAALRPRSLLRCPDSSSLGLGSEVGDVRT